jgi:3-hydroxybutyryl-CoA dehydrogenase
MAKALEAPRYEPPALIRRLMEEGKRGAREGEGLYDWRGRDLPAYQQDLLRRFVTLFDYLKLLPRPK